MIRKVLAFTLVMALASVANAQVTWDWIGDSLGSTWEAPALWTVTGTTTHTYPSQEFEGVDPLDLSAPPDYRYINSDITAINITNGDLVEKINETPFTYSSQLILGGDNCTLTVSNTDSQLYTGDDFFAGAGTGANTTINLTNGGKLSTDYAYCGYGGTCTVNISGGATFNPRNGSRLGWVGGTGYMTIDGGTFDGGYSLRLASASADATPIPGHAELTMQNSAVMTLGTDLQVGVGTDCTATATINNSSVSVGTDMRVGSNGTGTMDVENGSTVEVGDTLYVGRNSSGDGTMNISGDNSVVTNLAVGGGSGYNRTAIGYAGKGKVDITLGGDLICHGDLFVGDQSSGDGTLIVSDSGSSVSVTGTVGDEFKIGRNSNSKGIAEVKAGATVTSAVGCYVGSGTGATGTLNVDGPNSTVTLTAGRLSVGFKGTGKVNVTGGGKIIAGGELYVMDQSGSTGTMNITGPNSSVEANGSNMRIGRYDSGTGTVNVTLGGSLSVAEDLNLGYNPNAHAVLNISGTGSTVTVVGDDMLVGRGDGTAAEVSVSDGGLLDVAGDALYVGSSTNTVASLTLTGGGTVHVDGRSYIGNSGTGTVDITGATYNSDTDFRLAYNGTGKAFLNVDTGGVLNIGRDLETNANGDAVKDGDGLEATIHIYDGDVNIDGYCALGDMGQGGAVSTFIMDGGTVDIGLDPDKPDPPLDHLDNLIMGWYDTDAKSYLTINGGVMTVAGEIEFGRTTDHYGVPFAPLTFPTGSDQGQLRIDINGGILQAEDYIDAGTITDHLITYTNGQLRINASAVSETDMADLITAGDIVCTGTYDIYTDYFTPPSIPGDANRDGSVNAVDAQIVAQNWGATVAGGRDDGDFDNDGVVGPKDASIMAANWGNNYLAAYTVLGPAAAEGASAGSVPEPSTLMLLVSAVLGLLLWRRR